MADFDPTAYLSGDSQAGFDPAAYLKGEEFDPNKYVGGSATPNNIVSMEEASAAAAARAIPNAPPLKSSGNAEVDKYQKHQIGTSELLANLVTGGLGFTAGLLAGPAKALKDKMPLEKSVMDIAESMTYKPRTEYGEELSNKAIGAINYYGVPLTGIHIPTAKDLATKKAAIPQPDISAVIKKHKEVPVEPKPNTGPIPTISQRELPDSAMIQAPQYGVMEGMGRIDENGMPIKADVSMEAQQIGHPLQRNLWGDELPLKSPQEAPKGITAAMDEMHPAYRAAAIWREGLDKDLPATAELNKAIEASKLPFTAKEGPFSLPEMNRGMGRRQGGAINIKDISDSLSKLKQGLIKPVDYLKSWTGAMTKQEMDRFTSSLNDVNSRETVVMMSPEKFKQMAKTRTPDWETTGKGEIKREDIRRGLKSDEGLTAMPALLMTTDENGMATVWNHEGRHRMDVFQEQGIELVPVRIRDTGQHPNTVKWATEPQLPHTLMGENGIPMPFPEILSDRSWAPTPEMTKQVNDLSSGPGGRQRGALLISGESKPPKKDTITAPVSPEKIAEKADLRQKAAALKLKNTPYDMVYTIEEVLADPGKDLRFNPVRDYMSSGIGGQIYRNWSNNILKYVNTVASMGREAQEKFSTNYITGKEGLTQAFRKLGDGEWSRVAEALQEGSRQKTKLTDAMMTEMGFSPAQKNMVNKTYTMLEKMWEIGNDALLSQGLKPLNYHEGYVPSMFTGAYTSVIMDPKKNRVVAVPQADTRWGLKTGVDYFRKELDSGELVEIKQPRSGLKASVGYNRVFSGYNDLIVQLAKFDPEFAALKSQVDHHIAQSTHKLYSFDVHEKRKTGVVGALGDRPWLDKETNARQFLEGLINYGEEGSRYYTMQTPLNKISEMIANPKLQDHPNSIAYAELYRKHLAGQDLSVFGAAANLVLDTPAKMIGISPQMSSKGLSALRTTSTAHMMGLFNPGFFGTQLMQFWTGGMPEAAAIRSLTGLTHTDMATSFGHSQLQFNAINLEKLAGKTLKTVDPKLRAAYNWAEHQGMMYFSEVELAHEVMQSKTMKAVKNVANAPMVYGEKFTRPAIFLWYADLFNRAGLEGEHSFRVAKFATDYAMTNYHPDERPIIYSSLGHAGQFAGNLTSFKHNLFEQWYSRGAHAAKTPEALLAMAGLGYVFYGITGLPGYQEADQISQELTGVTIRRHLSDSLTESKSVLDGWVSASTGLDFQARMSMANAVPDSPTAAVVGPHVMNAANVMAKAITYAMEQDIKSRNEFLNAATPLGMRGFPEDILRRDEQGFMRDKDNQKKYPFPRTDEEASIRKWFGIRPLKERLEDEDLYARDKLIKKLSDEQRALLHKVKAATNFGDVEAAKSAAQEYIELGGDPRVFNAEFYKKIAIDKELTARQRRLLAPKPNLGSIRKYKEYNE